MSAKKRKRQPLPAFSADPAQGLTFGQVQQRLAAGWDNRVNNKAKLSEGQIIARNCFTFFNMVFVVMAVLLLLSGSTVKNLTFLVVVIINTIIGCVQQIRAKRAVDRLTLVASQTLKTRRDGQWETVRSDLLVRDDIVEFAAGDQICADAVLRTGFLRVNEALVTGEAEAIEKKPGDTLLSGSFVVAGRGCAQLTQVGDDSFAARLATEAKKDPKVARSEMMRCLDKLIRVVAFALIPIGLLLFFQEFHAQGLRRSAETTVAALVGMVPEGLYLLTSIALAASALKLTKKKVLVQDMNCIETLARVDVLCVDKTGTITEPDMAVEKIIPLSGQNPTYIEAVLAALYGTREPENETARAIWRRFGQTSDWVCTKYIPFTSDTKWSCGVFEGQGVFLVGAPEILLGNRYEALRQQAADRSAERVLLVACYAGDPSPEGLETDKVTPLALLLLSNPIRETAAQTFCHFVKQGVTVKVISGDDPVTVSRVAIQAQIPNAQRYIDTSALETEEDFLAAAEEYTVFGRVTPEKKRRLIRALQAKRHTVAMTGDGVNDVLAMKDADCAIAMASGAQAASQVAQMVLMESDFSAMTHIVGEGRRVINNIQRAASLFLVKNIFALGTSLISFLSPLSYPMAPLHMSIVSGLTIGIPSFFLAMEPNYERVQGRFLPLVLRRAFPGGLTNIFVILAAQIAVVAFKLPPEDMSTVCTAILAAVGMLVLYQVCKPFVRFRRMVWFTMLTALLLCFTVLGSFLELRIGSPRVLLIMSVLMAAAPVVLFLFRRAFDLVDKRLARVKSKEK